MFFRPLIRHAKDKILVNVVYLSVNRDYNVVHKIDKDACMYIFSVDLEERYCFKNKLYNYY